MGARHCERVNARGGGGRGGVGGDLMMTNDGGCWLFTASRECV